MGTHVHTHANLLIKTHCYSLGHVLKVVAPVRMVKYFREKPRRRKLGH